MKSFIVTLLLVCGLSVNGWSAILVLQADGSHTTVTTLEIARTQGATANKTIVVTSALTEAQSNITAAWPADRALKVEKGGEISNTTAFTTTGALSMTGGKFGSLSTGAITINGPFSAGDYQVFAGTGTVTGLKDVQVEWWGAKADGTTDSSVLIQKAINSVYATGGGLVRLGVGTYLLGTGQQPSGGAAFGKAFVLLEAKDKVSVKGEGTSTILKVANGFRDTTGGMAVLYNNYEYISDLTISDMTIDRNGQNNLILAGYSSAANIDRTGGNKCRNVTVERVHFKNIAGHHAVFFGDVISDSRNGNNRMLNCTVEEVCDAIAGNTSADFSGIYSYGNDLVVSGNILKNSVQSYKATALEVGGNNAVISNNTITKYSTAINAVAAYESTRGMSITGNTFNSVNVGVYLWAINAVVPTDPGFLLLGVNISDNTIYINDPSVESGAATAYGIIFGNGTDDATANPFDWVISNNTINMALNATSAYAMVNTGISLRPVSNLVISGNAISYFKGPAIALANMDGEVRSFNNTSITANVLKSNGYQDNDSTRRTSIYVGNNPNVPSSNLKISGNDIFGGAVGTATPMDYGIYFAFGGVPQYTSIKDNNIVGASVFDMYVTSFSATPYYFLIDHVAQKAGSPSAYRVAGTPGSRWVDSANSYVYNGRNHTSGATTLGVIPWRADITVVTDPQTTEPYSTYTWTRGDRAVAFNPTVGSPKAWSCTVSGTGGTLNGGATTGGITTGTTSLVVNSATGLTLGNYITIAGVTGVNRIVAISGTTVTIDTTADATVAGAAVAYQNPTWVSEGNL